MMAQQPGYQADDVRHYISGGLEHGGGIGRLVGYIKASASDEDTHAITDTRGPSWSPLRSPPFLAASLAAMTWDRIARPGRVHHIHVAGRGSTARKLILCSWARLTGCTTILHLHDFDYAADFERRLAWQKRRIRGMFRGVDRVVVLGRRDHDTVAGLLGVPSDRIVTLGNCVPDPGPARSTPRGKAPLILFLGTLGPRKGVPELLQALADRRLAGLNWTAVLAGDGPVEQYRETARDLGIADRVRMPGWLGKEDTAALLARADILVLPSHGEGMAMAVLEGLAYGLAVVTTKVGAHEEVIDDRSTGIFVPVGDAGTLAGTLACLVADPVERALLGAEARRSYEQRLSMPAYQARLRALYDQVRRGGRPLAVLQRKST